MSVQLTILSTLVRFYLVLIILKDLFKLRSFLIVYSLSSTDSLTIFRELVLCVNREGNEFWTGIHGYRPSNILENTLESSVLISLSNRERQRQQLAEYIRTQVRYVLQGMQDSDIRLWTPPASHCTDVHKHLINQTLRHNVYQGNLLRPAWIFQATNAARQFTNPESHNNLLDFINYFRMEMEIYLAQNIKNNKSHVLENFMTMCSNYAERHFGVTVRVTVKSVHQVAFGFLFTDDGQTLLNHPHGNALGDPWEFVDFLNLNL